MLMPHQFRMRIALALILGIALSGQAWALLPHEQAELYDIAYEEAQARIAVVEDIEITGTNRNIEQARQMAINAGKRIGLKRILLRYVRDQYDTQLLQQQIDDLYAETLEVMIAQFSLEEESFGRSKYRALLTLRFRNEKIFEFLISQHIPYSAVIAPRAVVVPFMIVDGTPSLWSENDPWLGAFHDLSDAQLSELAGALTFVFPHGDVTDFRTLTLNDLNTVNQERFSAFMFNYQASSLIFIRLKVQDNQISGLDVFSFGEMQAGLQSAVQFGLPERYRRLGAERYQQALAQMRDHVLFNMNRFWLEQTEVDPRQQVTIPLVLHTGAVDYIGYAEKKLSRLNTLQSLELIRYSADRADFILSVLGDARRARDIVTYAGVSVDLEQPNAADTNLFRSMLRGSNAGMNRQFLVHRVPSSTP